MRRSVADETEAAIRDHERRVWAHNAGFGALPTDCTATDLRVDGRLLLGVSDDGPELLARFESDDAADRFMELVRARVAWAYALGLGR